MSLQTIPYRFQVRGGTAAALATVNEVPLRRELVFEMDTGKSKLGDGTLAWNDLPYTSGGAGAEPFELQVSATHIQWRVAGEPDWTNLIALAELEGASGAPGTPGIPGTPGAPGVDGADGQSVELQKSATHIQWRLVGAPSWTNLAPLEDLRGPAGADAIGAAARAQVTVGAGTGTAAVGSTALLLAISCSAPARVRLYCTEAALAADAGRAAGFAPVQGSGLLLEFIATAALLGAPLTPGIVAYNRDAVPAGFIYASVQPDGATVAVTLTYLKLEA